MTERNLQIPLRGGRLLVAAIAVFVVTVFLPPVAAWRLNAIRVRQTQDVISSAAAYVRANFDALAAGNHADEILRGSGRLPFGSDAAAGEWVRRAVRSPESFGTHAGPDAWDRCLFLDLESLRAGGRVWVLSAGPDMIVETPPGSPVLLGDDLGEMIK